jgi:hypothetical protein
VKLQADEPDVITPSRLFSARKRPSRISSFNF